MTHYWLIKSLLLLALFAITYFLVRPTRTANTLALRRIGMLLVLASAVFAILFPGIFNHFAHLIGVASGINLLVYLVVVALFAQMASSYRRDAAMAARLTALAREVAIQQALTSDVTEKTTVLEEEIREENPESSPTPPLHTHEASE